MEAYERLSWQKPIPFTEIKAYYEAFDVPFTLGVFVDAMRLLEIEEIKEANGRSGKQTQSAG